LNDNLGICIACPVSSRIKNYAGCVVLKKGALNGLDHDSEIITFQVRTISKERLISKLGEIPKSQLEKLKSGLLEVLTY
jgi:mRNA interferase MazF